ncbi:MAG: cytosolic protein [Anaerolineaceae bacterium]|nr:MAG: cytosolic protein [Anaerolineaceae bacterium]
MKPLSLGAVNQYVNENIVDFHQRKLKSLSDLKLEKLLTKNPYLFRAKNLTTASELIDDLLNAFLSSSEEKLFGDFLEGLAVFVAEQTSGGHKSTAQGVDLEFMNNNTHYVVSIKSGPNWGNSSQQDKLEQDLKTSVARLKQSKHSLNVQPVLGICYGKTKTTFLRGYMKIVGQNFWYLISENPDLYTDIVGPIGYEAKKHNDDFLGKRNGIANLLTSQFINDFCDSKTGLIDWVKLIQFNSGNYKSLSKDSV